MRNVIGIITMGVVILTGCSDPGDDLSPTKRAQLDRIADEPNACSELQTVFDAADAGNGDDASEVMAYADDLMEREGCYE